MKRKTGPISPERLDALLRQHATPRQLEILDAIAEHGSGHAADEALGVSRGLCSRTMRRLKARVADTATEMHRDPDEVAPGQVIDGTSTAHRLWDEESGKHIVHWVKTKRDTGGIADLRAALADVLLDFNASPALPDPGLARGPVAEDTCVCIPIGDFHFGQYSDADECGSDYNLRIAEANWRAAFDLIVEAMPVCEVAVMLDLGDMTHGDNSKNVTPRSGFQLDVDTRHHKVRRVATRCAIYAAHRLRTKARLVRVRFNQGNHNPETSQGIALAVDAHFNGIEVDGVPAPSKEPSRIHVNTSPKDLEVVCVFGNVLITSSHGEHTKPHELPGLIMDDFAEHLGKDVLVYHHSGHVHHKQRVRPGDIPGLAGFESHRTLTPKDKHAALKYRSPQTIEAIVYNRHTGEEGRFMFPIARVEEKARG